MAKKKKAKAKTAKPAKKKK